MLTKTLFSKIIFTFILAVTALLLPLYLYVYYFSLSTLQTHIELIAAWTLLIILLFALLLKRLLNPLYCLIDVCHKPSTGSIEAFRCPGSSEISELSNAISTLIQSHQHLCDQKQDIFKEAAHELKSPIAILKARIALFEQHPKSDKETFIKEAKDDIQSITIKLKELLFLKEVEWGMQQSKEHFFMQDQCEMMRLVFAPILEKKGLSMVNTSSEDFDLFVHKGALQKVMQAIFENIFFHTKNNTTITTTVNTKNRSLQISNTIGNKNDETLFSSAIGMKIIQRISQKLNYSYETEQKDDVYLTTITFF